MLRTQIYSPDSCGCVVNESWDDENIDAPHMIVEYLAKCADHQHNDTTAYNIMIKENRMKNGVLRDIVDLLPPSMIDVTDVLDPKTNVKRSSKMLARDIQYNYYHKGEDPLNRKLIFSIQGLDKNGNVISLSNATKSSINNALSKTLGDKFQYVDILNEDLDPDYQRALMIRNTKDYAKATSKFREPTDEEKKQNNLLHKIKEMFTK